LNFEIFGYRFEFSNQGLNPIEIYFQIQTSLNLLQKQKFGTFETKEILKLKSKFKSRRF
jgi:hypothetical protein